MGQTKLRYSEEQWMTQEPRIYYLRCHKGMNSKDLAKSLAQERNFKPTQADLMQQMDAWGFQQGVGWDLPNCPHRYLEEMGIGKAFSNLSPQFHDSTTIPALRVRAGPDIAKSGTAPRLPRHDGLVVAGKPCRPRVRTYREHRYRRLAQSEKSTRSMHLNKAEAQQESFPHEPSATPTRLAVNAAVQPGLPVSRNSHEGMTVAFQPGYGYSTFADVAHPPNPTGSTLGRRSSSQPSLHGLHRAAGYDLQYGVPIQTHNGYNEYPYPGPDYGSSTDMTGEGHAPSSMPYGGPP